MSRLGRGVGLSLRPAFACPPQTRSFLHLPPILAGAAVAGKVMALLMLKKVVVLGLIKQYGVGRVFAVFREANDDAQRTLGSSRYPPFAKLSVDQGIDALEQVVKDMDKATEQADAILNWLKKLDPTVLAVFAKDLLQARQGSEAPKVTLKPKSAEHAPVESDKDREANEMIQLIMKRVPELKSRYVVVLIDKD